MTITFAGVEIILLPQRAIFIPEHRILALADLHLGKMAHFRKHGIFAPKRKQNEDLESLDKLIQDYAPEKVVFLGDLFHSEPNIEYHEFEKWLKNYPKINFVLTKGNHDIIPKSFFLNNKMELVNEFILTSNLILAHQLQNDIVGEKYYIVGHVHPGVLLSGKGKQRFRLPCFYQQKNIFILPAFGYHTGLFIIEREKDATTFVILDNEIIALKN